MFVPALLVIVALAVVVLIARTRPVKPDLYALPQPEQSASEQNFQQIRTASRSLEIAHVANSGPLALNSKLIKRVRPGHHCVEELRVRCNQDYAGAISYLEGQFARSVSANPLEQARYWIDVAEGVRSLHLFESLPTLLRRSDEALDLPLAEGYAAELVAFPNFSDYLHDPLSREGQAALRLLRVAMEGVRLGRVSTLVYADGGFGNAIRRLAENCPDAVSPRLVLTFVEAMRHCRRNLHNSAAFASDPVRRQNVRWQLAFMRDAEPVMREYLHDIGPDLAAMLECSDNRGRKEILRAIAELQADSDEIPISLLGAADDEVCELALKCLRWSQSDMARTALCGIARFAITGEQTSRWLRRLGVGRKKEMPTVIVKAAIWALRGHPSHEAEQALLSFSTVAAPEWQIAALQSLGWWEPLRRAEVLAVIREARVHSDSDVRKAALALSARLGECAAIQTVCEQLNESNPSVAIDAIRFCAQEGLTWLWPDLDQLTECSDASIAAEAWEAVENLREGFLGPLG